MIDNHTVLFSSGAKVVGQATINGRVGRYVKELPEDASKFIAFQYMQIYV